MPMYDWKCTKCGATEATVEPMDNRDVPPEQSSSPTCGEHVWERQLAAPTKAYAEGWGENRKGKYNSQS
jgi:putative FmdB family regulatory protein